MNHPTVARLLGGEIELRELDSALERTTAGCGSLLVVTGEAGIGKSRILATVTELGGQRRG